MKADLHNHTVHSDGVYTPLMLLDNAYKNKMDIIALTDHDSVFGINEILAIKSRVKVIAGMELSTYYKGENIHIVCLFKKNKINDELLEFSRFKLEERKNRSITMLNNLKSIYNLKVDINALENESEVITRGNILRHVMKLNNLTKEEAWKYLDKDSLAYIPSTKLSVSDGLEFAHKNNAIAILAHPGLENRDYINEIIGLGFDGIEVYYPTHSEEDIKYFKELAKKYNLLISGGSDCHGDHSHAKVGTSYIEDEDINKILERLMITWK